MEITRVKSTGSEICRVQSMGSRKGSHAQAISQSSDAIMPAVTEGGQRNSDFQDELGKLLQSHGVNAGASSVQATSAAKLSPSPLNSKDLESSLIASQLLPGRSASAHLTPNHSARASPHASPPASRRGSLAHTGSMKLASPQRTPGHSPAGSRRGSFDHAFQRAETSGQEGAGAAGLCLVGQHKEVYGTTSETTARKPSEKERAPARRSSGSARRSGLDEGADNQKAYGRASDLAGSSSQNGAFFDVKSSKSEKPDGALQQPSKGLQHEERRIDPALDNQLLTFAEMCSRLRDQQLTTQQLHERWERLKPQAHAGSRSLAQAGASMLSEGAMESPRDGGAGKGFRPPSQGGGTTRGKFQDHMGHVLKSVSNTMAKLENDEKRVHLRFQTAARVIAALMMVKEKTSQLHCDGQGIGHNMEDPGNRPNDSMGRDGATNLGTKLGSSAKFDSQKLSEEDDAKALGAGSAFPVSSKELETALIGLAADSAGPESPSCQIQVCHEASGATGSRMYGQDGFTTPSSKLGVHDRSSLTNRSQSKGCSGSRLSPRTGSRPASSGSGRKQKSKRKSGGTSAHQSDEEDPASLVTDEEADSFLSALFAEYTVIQSSDGQPLMNNVMLRRFFVDFMHGKSTKTILASADVAYADMIQQQEDLHFHFELSKRDSKRGLCVKAFEAVLSSILPGGASRRIAKERFAEYSGDAAAMRQALSGDLKQV